MEQLSNDEIINLITSGSTADSICIEYHRRGKETGKQLGYKHMTVKEVRAFVYGVLNDYWNRQCTLCLFEKNDPTDQTCTTCISKPSKPNFKVKVPGQ